MRISEYNVITANSSSELAQKVNMAINLGWQPIGGVSIATLIKSDGVTTYFLGQAMGK